MWSARAPRRFISPPAIPTAAKYVATSIRSGITVCSTATKSLTPSIVIVDEPAPSTFAPIRFRNAARSAISGSLAAFSIIVSPSARTAAIMIFSVAPTLGKSRTIRDPTSFSASASIYPCSELKRTPRASSPLRCISMGRGPKSSPPGRATLAFPYVATSGPKTTIEARIFSTCS